MGVEFTLAHGDSNQTISPELSGCLVEVRVEQTLQQPTKFAVRFLDDIVDERQGKAQLPELQIEQLFSVIVSDNDGNNVCLVRGPIVDHKAEITRGGSGSWFEIHGVDRRDLLARNFKQGKWTGTADEIVQRILSEVYSDVKAQETTEVYDIEAKTLQQRSSDLDFVKKNADEHGFHVWVSYETAGPAPNGKYTISEKIHWESSPPIDNTSALELAPPISIANGSDAVQIRFNVPDDQCPNVTSLRLSVDGRAPTAVSATSSSTEDGSEQAITEEDQSLPLSNAGESRAQQGPARFHQALPSGDPSEGRTVALAALREASFFVNAEIETTKYYLKNLLQPHQLVNVHGLGTDQSKIPFRVNQVTHVINGRAHFMNAKLATNVHVPQN